MARKNKSLNRVRGLSRLERMRLVDQDSAEIVPNRNVIDYPDADYESPQQHVAPSSSPFWNGTHSVLVHNKPGALGLIRNSGPVKFGKGVQRNTTALFLQTEAQIFSFGWEIIYKLLFQGTQLYTDIALRMIERAAMGKKPLTDEEEVVYGVKGPLAAEYECALRNIAAHPYRQAVLNHVSDSRTQAERLQDLANHRNVMGMDDSALREQIAIHLEKSAGTQGQIQDPDRSRNWRNSPAANPNPAPTTGPIAPPLTGRDRRGGAPDFGPDLSR